jgi:hypothetical protein
MHGNGELNSEGNVWFSNNETDGSSIKQQLLVLVLQQRSALIHEYDNNIKLIALVRCTVVGYGVLQIVVQSVCFLA